VETQTGSSHSATAAAPTDIVVVVDHYPPTRRALATATQIAQRLGLPLRLVTVHRPNGSGAEYSARHALVDEMRRLLIASRPDLEPHVDARVLVGDRIACPICEAHPSPIVVMGTDSVARRTGTEARSEQELARHAHHHPVIVVGPAADPDWRPGPVAVALDGSPVAESALADAIHWATAIGVTLEIIQVVPRATNALPAEAVCSPYLHAVRRQLERDAIPVNCRTIVSDDTAGAIAQYLRDQRCSMVVMTTHGHRDGQREAFAGITMGVLAQSPCPVRVVRPHTVPQPILA
jgi:nucleotide-binding universal stress UspA family protein